MPLACSMTTRLLRALAELLVDDLGLGRGAVLKHGDGRDVRHGLRRCDVHGPHHARIDVEQVESADHGTTQSHRQCVHRREARGQGFGCESGPTAAGAGQVLVDHRFRH
jgi:hypothetical protein